VTRAALLLLLPLLGCTQAIDLPRAQTFEEAGKLYTEGRYADAATRYQALVDGGLESGAVLYDLGNARLKAGERGRAVAAYRRALFYRPRDPYLRANLAAARATADEESRPLSHVILFWHDWVSYPGKFHLLALAATVTFLLAVLALFRRPLRPAVWAALGVTLLFALSAGLAYEEVARTGHGVVVADGAVARKGNAESFAPAFTETLPEGTEFTVVDRRDGWILVRLPNGPEGWLPTGAVSTW
jgi:tetratricopeptide (TPR) repeat protein